MKRTIHQAETAAFSRMCSAVERVLHMESKAAKEQANKWARAWQDKYLKLAKSAHNEASGLKH
ncbi:MAG: hypothetical protein WCG50_14145 [Rhodoferax sp.]|uniref:hypothetical protein n=1 Tax=Rhodoferax sp. TaxID=50421 RepID=UPI00301B1F39